MTTHIALRIAVLCGMMAFGWVLLSSAPPPAPARPSLAPPLPDDADGLLQWLADGYGDRDPGAWRHAGEIFLWRAEHTAARRAWRQAVRLSRGAPQRWGQYTLAWSLARLQHREADEHVNEVIEQMRQRESQRGATAASALSRALLLRVAGHDEKADAELKLARLRLAAAGGGHDREDLYTWRGARKWRWRHSSGPWRPRAACAGQAGPAGPTSSGRCATTRRSRGPSTTWSGTPPCMGADAGRLMLAADPAPPHSLRVKPRSSAGDGPRRDPAGRGIRPALDRPRCG